MSVQTRIFTQHTVSQPGAPFQANLMLDDDGRGNITLIGPDGPALTIDAARVEPLVELLREADGVRKLMAQSGTDLLIGEPEPNEQL